MHCSHPNQCRCGSINSMVLYISVQFNRTINRSIACSSRPASGEDDAARQRNRTPTPLARGVVGWRGAPPRPRSAAPSAPRLPHPPRLPNGRLSSAAARPALLAPFCTPRGASGNEMPPIPAVGPSFCVCRRQCWMKRLRHRASGSADDA
jgi:hypothetical protein